MEVCAESATVREDVAAVIGGEPATLAVDPVSGS
jgi:hypothetical protein